MGGPITQTLESDDTPPPMPFNCRPCGSGLPMALRKRVSHSARSAGRSRRWNISALLVPPRMNTAGSRLAFIDGLFYRPPAYSFCATTRPAGFTNIRYWMPLAQVATLSLERSIPRIEHFDAERSVTVTSLKLL